MAESPSQTTPLAPGRSDVVPGHVLSPLPLYAYAELEDEFARRHVAYLVAGSLAVDANSWDRAMRLASEEVRMQRFGVGSIEFDNAMMHYGTVPLLLYLSVRVTNPKITRQQAAELLTDENFLDVRRALLEMMGYSFFERPAAPSTGQVPNDAGQSTGTTSPIISDDHTADATDSATTKSAA